MTEGSLGRHYLDVQETVEVVVEVEICKKACNDCVPLLPWEPLIIYDLFNIEPGLLDVFVSLADCVYEIRV